MKKSGHIVIVDDDSAHRLLIHKAIKNSYPELDVIETDSLEAAKTSITEYRLPILVFLDLNLGKERGITLLQFLRQQKWGEDIPIIILSTSALDEEVKEAYDSRASAFMVKNSSLTLFQEEIKMAVSFFIR